MIKEKWPYILVVILLLGGGFAYIQCQPSKAKVSWENQTAAKEMPTAETTAESKNQDEPKTENPKVDDMVVDIKGAVKTPGVYHMMPGDRVEDVLEKAGGFTSKADKAQVNLAKKLADEMMIYIPSVGEKMPENAEAQTAPASNGTSGSGKININTASEQELEQISGIGPSKAGAIIEYREKNGPFQKVEDLDKVSGFGEKTLERMKDQITVQ